MTRMKWSLVAAIALLFSFSLFSTVLSMFRDAGSIRTSARGSGLPVIVLDPGHGGIDGGAVGVDGIVEKDINLSISIKLRDLLLLSGFEVVMTREEDISIHDPDVTGTRKQKTSDLRNRLAIQNSYPDVIFISIHQNKFGDSRQNGTQVFYGHANARSEELAEITQREFIRLLQPDNKRLQKKGGKNLFLLYGAKCPAILIECGFLSNPTEARRLTAEEYQSQLAFAAFSSVMRFLELDSPDSV